jgi:hypothetical protein
MKVVMSSSDRVVGFSQAEGVDLNDTLASRFSELEGGALVEIVASVARGFEVHERDFYAHNLMMTLYQLLLPFSLSLIFQDR